jgi:DNA-binding CsgD family transcriptional regulator
MPGDVLGRERELESAANFFQELDRRSPAALVIEGEAGIGKTTLWLEAVKAAEIRGYRVLLARPAESEAKLSYAALADLIGDAFDETRSALPEPQERALAMALLRVSADKPADARATAAALVSVLTALAAEQPVLVAVDDVQWLDAASERALQFAARRLPLRLGLLVTRRTEGEGEAPLGLGRALPEDRLDRVVPGPLSLAAVHHLIRSRLGTSLPRPLLARLVAASGGNPFFALEIARALACAPDDRALTDPLPVPQSLHELVAARLRRLSSPAQEALLIAAALFRPTITALAEALAPSVEADPVLAEVEKAGLLVSEQGRVRFAHPLLASVAYGSASEERRRQLHRRLAKLAAGPEERARHLARSATEVDEATAGEIEGGARQAALRGAQDAAAELFEAAHRLTSADRPDELAGRLLGHASALNAMGDFDGAHSSAERALEYARAPSLRAEVLSLLGSLAWFRGAARDACRYLEDALAAAVDDRELQGPISAKLVRFYFTNDFERAVERADAAMRLLSEDREPALLAHVLIDRFFAGALLGLEPRRVLLQRGLELEAKTLATLVEAPHPIPLIWFHCADEFDAARARYAMEDEWYRERGEDVWRADRRSHIALAELRAGEWELAEQYVEDACAALEHVAVRGPLAMVFEKRAFVDAHRGRIERARATLSPLIERAQQTQQVWWAALSLSTLAVAEFAAGDYQAVDRALTQMREYADSLRVRDVLVDRSEPFHIESLLALGELERARDLLVCLEERGHTLPRLWITAALPRARALVLAAEGDVAAALAEVDGLDLEVESRLPFELGWTLLVKGRLLRRTKQKRAAADALGRALDIFEQLGAQPWSEQARGELQRVGLRPRAPAELTESERRVAELVAKGLTNREVAARLFMSPKTVEANLARVYRKLGISSRAELGAQQASLQSASPQM